MAMTLRLTDAELDGLRTRAAAEQRSMQDVARDAIRRYVGDREERLAQAIARISQEDAELLDRLGK